MFKSENDKKERFGIAVTGNLETNSNATINMLAINSDATVGTLTISAKTRLSDTFEPVNRSDGVTQIVIDLATTERTIRVPFGIKEWRAVPAGLDNTFYEMAVSGAGE